ncbi:cytochrome C oxidase subunit IV family protein [Nocardioides sp. NPDC101246]|uniref:cytochrome C oxidase subunit IV family protein n=1 Tax=Nocardioides sp. NPDC101246 TaxID=3364336 RepID=UPI00382EB2D0
MTTSYAAKMLRHQSTIVWALLMIATIASWHLGTDHAFAGGARVATVGVIVIAFIKVAMVTTSFMEVAHAPRLLQSLVHGWTFLVCALLALLYLAL